MGSLEQDMKFKLQVLETELEEERKRNKFDFAAIDRELKSEYESRWSKQGGNVVLSVFS